VALAAKLKDEVDYVVHAYIILVFCSYQEYFSSSFKA
jgi:hypothetical protein